MIKVYDVLFPLFLQGRSSWSGVTLDKVSSWPDKMETLKFSLQISIYEGFYILVHLLDKLVIQTDPDLFTVFSVSFHWAYLDLSNY